MTRTELDSLNRESDEQAAERLRACNAAPRWIAQVLTGRPYSDVGSLLDTAERAARALDWGVQQALDAHPRIGERAEGTEAARPDHPPASPVAARRLSTSLTRST